ncbi:MAG: hypothetical protein QFC78_08155 [Pseudomonadota bacterium]|nr:hypothetical protein [Pseudomonadota bacterium]
MAFNDETRRFWHIDLTTRAGARSAAYQGAVASFIFCVMGVLGIVVGFGMVGTSSPQGLALVGGAALEAAVGLVAGLRLRSGKGAYWGMAAAVLAALELLGKMVALSIGGVIICGIILVFVIQGIRGALALKNTASFEDDDIEVFG